MPAPPQIATWFILFAGLGQVDGAWYTEDKDELIITEDNCIDITVLAKDISISCDSYALSLRPARPGGLFVDSLTQGSSGLSPQGWGWGWAGAGLAETYVLGNAAIHFQPQNRSSPSSLCMHSVSQLQPPISIAYDNIIFSFLFGARTISR
ncbi:hypothetical protein FBULB1_3476 [Fusarium bulbicola]|nr:hypothetical protein FBULB1_3476 [Fusarium bulbicola]